MKLLALTGQDLGPIRGKGLGTFGEIDFGKGGTLALQKVTGAISSIVGFMTIVGSIWFMFQLLFGGYEWISSAGDTKKLTTARQRIMNGFFGLTIIIAAWIILAVVGQFFGYDILVGDPGTIIRQLKL
jgi:nitrate reductase NapE component